MTDAGKCIRKTTDLQKCIFSIDTEKGLNIYFFNSFFYTLVEHENKARGAK